MIDLIESFYQLKADPFRLTSDYHFAYLHSGYKKALAYLKFAAYREEGFVMVTGKPGTGKTTLIHKVLAEFDPGEVLTAVLVTTQLEAQDLLHMVSSLFRIPVTDLSKSSLLLGIEQFLKNKRAEGRRVILIIDEAQGLHKNAVEELRLLSNLVADGRPLMQMFLVGQEELKDLVSSPELEQLRQRIVAAAHLDALGEEEVFAYVRHRLDVAGWRGDPQIENAVVRRVAHYSGGVPRIINLIFSRLMLHGCIEEKHTLDTGDMDAVIGELKEELLVGVKLNSTADGALNLEDGPEGYLEPIAPPPQASPQPAPVTEPVTEPGPAVEAPEPQTDIPPAPEAEAGVPDATPEPAVSGPTLPEYDIAAEEELIASLIDTPENAPGQADEPAATTADQAAADDTLVIEPDGACHAVSETVPEDLAPSLLAGEKPAAGEAEPAASPEPPVLDQPVPIPAEAAGISTRRLMLYIIAVMLIILVAVFLASAVMQARGVKERIGALMDDAGMQVTPAESVTGSAPDSSPYGRSQEIASSTSGTIVR